MLFKKGHIPWNKGKKCPQLSGKNHPMYGKHHSEEHKKKISESEKGKIVKKGNKSYAWKGGRIKHSRGYVYIYQPNHPYVSGKNYVFEHRLVIEKYLGKYLETEKVIHHINGIVDDNRIRNLMVFTKNVYHRNFHRFKHCKPKHIIFDGRKL